MVETKTSKRRQLTDVLLEFLEVVVHEFLYQWRVYPQEAFTKRVMYDVPVHMNRHPQLCEYVHSMLVGCREWIHDGVLEKLCIAVLAANGKIINTLVVETSWTASLLQDRSAALGRQEDDEPLPLRAIEDHFRSTLVGVTATPVVYASNRESKHAPASFRLLAHTSEDSSRPETAVNGQAPANSWVLADPFWYKRGEGKTEHELLPVKSVRDDQFPFRLHVYLER
ncbi:hypothetical protein Poli38472_002162 [Pythium oligandrum]|uniref:HORMA domain-containing protein n=1 Tax=Pythium oligandrum TaxID=41045 RepID=A0A8K1CI63_PYTOL|nr:hypothetical protein Poli38472_002162 [Pythium oligandrum]|eukprot:TMW63221.1 hypothetical protein Poli38472_002162 [Pythium oligandrum]